MKRAEIARRAHERRMAIRTLRLDGMTYREIGEALGISRQRAHRIMKKLNEREKG